MRQGEEELGRRLELGMKPKWSWSLTEKPVRELVWLVWSSWMRKLKWRRKRETLEGQKWLNSTKPEENQKTETRSMNSRNECAERYNRDHKQSQVDTSILLAVKS